MANIKNVLVVGGGIGGQSAAIGFAKAGVKVEIVEILPEFNVYGVGIIQQGNALKALDKLGVADEAMHRGSPYGQVKMYTASGHFIGEAGPPPMGKFPSHNGISRRILHDVMYDEAQKLGIPYRMGLTVESIKNMDEGVDVIFTDGSSGSYDLLVASDGVRSKVRDMIFGKMEARYMGLSVWRYPFKRHKNLDTGYIYYGKRSKIGYIPMSSESMYMFMVTEEGADNPFIPHEQFIPMMQDYMTEYSDSISIDVVKEMTDRSLVNYRPLEALHLPDPWYDKSVIVIGDGAHATVPQLGSGAALAIEDAVVLVEEIQKTETKSEALAVFMKRRYDRCMMVVEASEKLAEWELLEFTGQPLPEGANPGALMGKTIGGLMAPF